MNRVSRTLRRPLPVASPPPLTVPNARDHRLDFARGLAIVVMVIDHLVGDSWLHALTLYRFYATAAEGFVVCSGFVLGMLSRRRCEQSSERHAIVKALKRAGTLYVTAVMLLLGVGLLATIAPALTRPCFDVSPGSPLQVVMAALTLNLAPPIIDVLPLYVSCLLLTPALIICMRRGLWLPMLVVSVAVWAVNWSDPYTLAGAPLDRGRPYFAFASWQLLFVASFAAGWGRTALQRACAWAPRAGWAFTATGITLVLAVAAAYDAQMGAWPAAMPDRESWLAATDRSLLGPVRLVAITALFPLIYGIIDAAWRPLSRNLGRFVLPLGRHALYVYILHVPLVIAWTGIVAPNLGGNALIATLGQAGVVALLWYAVHKRFLFGWLPQ